MGERRIRVLPDDLANRIAAGEVVERPASVVKELVENAIDAGATHVRVAVEGAGKVALRVEDDGCGMARDDALLAIERHATSKIANAADLDNLHTLGFRGEALPSIASVSKFTLTTRPDGESEGTRVRIEGGRLLEAAVAGAPRGTAVEVRDLFFNVPARKKFLKSDATELRTLVDGVTQLALVNPGVGLELRSGGRVLVAVPPGAGLEERVGELVGSEAPGGLHWGRFPSDGRELVFAFGAPHEGRGRRKNIRLFVNGRPVQDRLLFRALLEGYRGLLGGEHNPVALLWLRLPPDEVDVNVHPAKREVRFSDEGRVFRWVAGCVANALAGGPWSEPAAHPSFPPPPRGEGAAPRGVVVDRTRGVAEALEGYGQRAAVSSDGLSLAWGGRPRSEPLPLTPRPPLAPCAPDPGERPPPGRFGALRFLGSVGATYLLFEDVQACELVVLDQHAAHERLLYETLLGEEAGVVKRQTLLFPVALECSEAEMAGFADRKALLASLGVEVETFGTKSVAVTEVPAGLPLGAVEGVVRDLLGAEELWGDVSGERDRRDAAAARAACAGAVKAGSALTPSEAEALLARLEPLRNPGHCPHGRPALLRFSTSDFEKLFHRK